VIRAALAAVVLALPAATLGAEKFAVIAVGDPAAGPDGDVTELTYQLRAACRDRVPNVLDPSDMRGRLLGRTSNANESELDRAYGGALAVYQNGEFDSSLRTLRAIVGDLESLPETEESYFQWKRANLRLALSAMATNDPREIEAALGKVIRMEPSLQPDPDQFSPGFRKRFEEVRAKIRTLPRRRLAIAAEGRQGTVYVNGKNMGTTPVSLTLPAGVYRVGGGAGTLRVPSFRVDLEQEDRSVILDFALAESLRMNAGPGLALALANRANGVIRAGAWLGVDKLIVVSRSEEGQAQFLVGAIYDVLRGALLREGSVRMVAGGVPSVNLSALAAFLLTGQASREVKELSRDAPRRGAPPSPVAASEHAPLPSSAAPPRVAAVTSSAQPPTAGPASPAPVAATPTASPQPASAKAGPPARPSVSTGAPPTGLNPAAPVVTAPAHPAAPVATPAALVGASPGGAARPDLDIHPTAKPTPRLGLADPLRAANGGRRFAWKKPVSIGAGVLALGLAGFALQQNGAASRAYSQAGDQLTPSGAYKDAEATARYRSLRSDGDRARTNTTIAAGAAAVCAITSVIVGWKAWRTQADPGLALQLEF
jgi:hypothetical protein